MSQYEKREAIKLCLAALDSLLNENDERATSDWKAGVTDSKERLRKVLLDVTRVKTDRAPLEKGSLAEVLAAWCWAHPKEAITDEYVSKHLNPRVAESDVYFHVAPAVLHCYIETVVVNRQRAYRRYGFSRELDSVKASR